MLVCYKVDSNLFCSGFSLQVKSLSLKVYKGTDLKPLTTHLTKVPGLLLLPDETVTCTVPRKFFLISSNIFLPEIISWTLLFQLITYRQTLTVNHGNVQVRLKINLHFICLPLPLLRLQSKANFNLHLIIK